MDRRAHVVREEAPVLRAALLQHEDVVLVRVGRLPDSVRGREVRVDSCKFSPNFHQKFIKFSSNSHQKLYNKFAKIDKNYRKCLNHQNFQN